MNSGTWNMPVSMIPLYNNFFLLNVLSIAIKGIHIATFVKWGCVIVYHGQKFDPTAKASL